jgi:hypothetical protein
MNSGNPPRAWRSLPWLITYAIAMAYVESAVVVYLRGLYYPHGFAFPVSPMPGPEAVIEIGREAATLVMLLAVAGLAGTGWRSRVLLFGVAFGIWDLFYYVWLWVLLRWPPSLLTWDILFLIPVPWIGPVLAPVIVSVVLVTGGLFLLRRDARGEPLSVPRPAGLMAIGGCALVLASFMLDFQIVLRQLPPPPFRWGLFGAGVGLGVVGLGMVLRTRH